VHVGECDMRINVYVSVSGVSGSYNILLVMLHTPIEHQYALCLSCIHTLLLQHTSESQQPMFQAISLGTVVTCL